MMCEKNSHEWENSLKEYGLWPEKREIVEGFSKGLVQGIQDAEINGMAYYCPPNHASANEAREKIEENFRVEVDSKRIF